jgi:hypothetical protein
MRTQEHVSHRGNHGHGTIRTCRVAPCAQSTREGKPFCPDHVDQHSYVQEILRILEERKAEEDRVRNGGPEAVNLKGLTARELMVHLMQHGSRTVERLSREFQLEAPVMHDYVSALHTQGLVVVGRTTRGSTVVRLAS